MGSLFAFSKVETFGLNAQFFHFSFRKSYESNSSDKIIYKIRLVSQVRFRIAKVNKKGWGNIYYFRKYSVELHTR